MIVVGYSTRGLGAFPAVHWEFAHLIHAFYEVGGISIDFVESLGAGPGTAVRHTRVASSQIVQNLAIAEFQQFRQLEAKKMHLDTFSIHFFSTLTLGKENLCKGFLGGYN